MDRVNVEVLMEEVADRVEFGGVAPGSAEPQTPSVTAAMLLLPLLLLVVTAAPFKLFIRAEGLLLGVATRFLGALASAGASPLHGLTLELRLHAVLMLSCEEVDTPDAVSGVMDAPCD